MASNSAPIVDRIRLIPRPDDFLDRNVGSSGEVFYDKGTKTLRLYDGLLRGGATVITDSNLNALLGSTGVAALTYTITVVSGISPDTGNVYVVDGVYKPALNFVVGYTYIFDQSDQTNLYYPNAEGGTLNTHPLNFSADDQNGPRGTGTTYLDGVNYYLDDDIVTKEIYDARYAKATNRKVTITVTSSTPTTLYYWCTNHNNMGSTITVSPPGGGGGGGSSGASVDVSDTAPASPVAGNIWFKSDTGKLFVYVNDGDSSQWIQPSTPVPNISTFQNITIKDSDSSTIVADVANDTLTFEEGDGIELVINSSTNTLKISSTTSGGGGGADLSAFSVITQAASGGGELLYNNSTGEFTYTPPNISGLAESDTLDTVITRGNTTTQSIVLGDVTADDITADSFLNSGVGSPSITSATTFTMTAPDGVIVTGGATGGPFRLPSFTTVQKNTISAVNGDMVYDTDLNKAQVYENGAWTNLV